ncbi:MAG: DUF4351 domain-containing protein, partial [Blastocatellia bacterium]
SYKHKIERYEEEKRMPYVTTIERMGIQRGLQQGLQEGSCRQLLRVLHGRFGQTAEELRDDLAKLSVEQIDVMTDQALFAPSLSDFIAAIPKPDDSSTITDQNLTTASDDIHS